MMQRWIVLATLLMIALPSALYAGWIKDKVYMQTEEVGKVEFSHYTHMATESVGRNCQACHNHVFHVVKKKNQDYTMSEMEEGKSCGFCHNGEKAFGVDGDCATCHAGDIVYIDEDAGNATFPHEAHTEMYGCDECHSDLFKPERGANEVGMEAMENGESCGACHDGSTAFNVAEDCESCHDM